MASCSAEMDPPPIIHTYPIIASGTTTMMTCTVVKILAVRASYLDWGRAALLGFSTASAGLIERSSSSFVPRAAA